MLCTFRSDLRLDIKLTRACSHYLFLNFLRVLPSLTSNIGFESEFGA